MSVPASRRSEHTILDRPHPDNPALEGPALARIRPPASVRGVAWLIALAIPVFAFIALVVPWQQNALSSGRVIAYAPQERQQPIEAPISGRIETWFVAEGERVVKGQPLVELRDNDPDLMSRLEGKRDTAMAARTAAEQQIASYERKLEAAIAARDLQVAELEAKIQGTLQKRAGEAAESETAQLNLDRLEVLAQEGIASTRDLEVARMKARKTETSLQARNREISAMRQAQQKARAEAESKIESTRAELEAARSKLAEADRKVLESEVKVARQASQVIRAPRDGTILRLHGGLGGGQIKAGDAVATLVPTTDSRAVELWVDGNDMPFIDEGTMVRLVFEGWPALQFVGLHGASTGTFEGRVAFIDATDDGAGKFRTVVIPTEQAEWPDGVHLRQGVRAKGFFLLGRVPLGYELWRQINGFPPMPSVEKGDKTSLPTNKKPRAPASLK